MYSLVHAPALTIVGLSIRTNNAKAFNDIPPVWGAFFEQAVLSQIPNRLSDELYAVYTDFDRIPERPEDVYTLGYSFVLGCAVSEASSVPAGLANTQIPVANRAVFNVEPARPDQVGPAWQQIWQMHDLPRQFLPDYEHYSVDGAIRILVSVRS